MFKKLIAASLLAGFYVWHGAAAKGVIGGAAGSSRAIAGAEGGYEVAWTQDRWDGPAEKGWNGKNSYWGKTAGVDLEFMPPWLSPGSAWAPPRELLMASASRFSVSTLEGKTAILCGGVGKGAQANTGVVCYAEDRGGSSWKVSPVKDSEGFSSVRVTALSWLRTATSGYIYASTFVQSQTLKKTPLFYRAGAVPTPPWVSVPPDENPRVPPMQLKGFSAVAAGPAPAAAEVYVGVTGTKVGEAEVYRRHPRGWALLGGKLAEAKGVISLYATEAGVLAGTEPMGMAYQWKKSEQRWYARRVGNLTAGGINDLAKVGDYIYAAAGGCSPGPKARLFRTKDYIYWEDVTPAAVGAATLNAFVAVDEFGGEGAVAALGDNFNQVYVARHPGTGDWGVVKGDGGVARDVVGVTSGTDFWGNFVAYEKGGLVFARRFAGFNSGGELYSSVYDAEDKLVRYKKLEFEGAMASGGAKFWLRAADDYDAFKTPGGSQTGEPAWLEAPPGQPLPAELDNKRFVQYKVRLDVPEGLKFPPVLKRVRLAMLSPYGKVVETYPPNRAEKQAAEVPITFWFSKGVRPETIKKENVVIRGKRRQYNWPRYIYRKDNFEFTVYHDVFEADDAITVTLESTPGRRILDSRGKEIDPDGDGEPGGRYKFSFTVGSGGGPVISEPFRGEREGPIVYDVKVEPNPTYGETEVRITATADDTKRGNSNIAAAEFSVGREPAPPGQGEPMEGEFKSPKVTVFAETDIGGQPRRETRLIVYVRAQDAFANWGDATAAPIFILPPEFLPKEYVYFYPNPCREDMGYFHFLVTRDSDVNVCIYDMRGRLVGEIGSYAQAYSGERGLPWDVSGIGADVYFFTLTARAVATGEVASVTKKLAVLK
ncbi:MAG: hypothetical protein GTN49_12475 [candidate division Zixibacteria bacterium]|nr:hypothetical protein [candidate division Zixibacteria bacterium]